MSNLEKSDLSLFQDAYVGGLADIPTEGIKHNGIRRNNTSDHYFQSVHNYTPYIVS